jgi:hypothetical protein
MSLPVSVAVIYVGLSQFEGCLLIAKHKGLEGKGYDLCVIVGFRRG